jgi:hypothetical protein
MTRWVFHASALANDGKTYHSGYKDALVADLNGGAAVQRVRVDVSDFELEIAGIRLANAYEYGGRVYLWGRRVVCWQSRGGLSAATAKVDSAVTTLRPQ